jgi:cytochrome c peroxidase
MEIGNFMYQKSNKSGIYLASIVCLFTLFSCQKENVVKPFEFTDFIPAHYPYPILSRDSMPTEAQFLLGRKLFYDPVLSRDSSISCASCHKPELAFADTLAISPGIRGRQGMRNTPSIANVGYQKKLLRDGGLPTLEMQVLVPIQEHAEFDHDIVSISNKMLVNATYVKMSIDAYKRNPDPYVITRAIAAFERSIFSGSSKYDLYLRGQVLLSPEEKMGLDLFYGTKANCSSCHTGYLQTNQNIVNTGLYEKYEDKGAMRASFDPNDEGKFKVPSLRNVGLTPPYMHDGSFKTLEEVLDHYNKGGKNHKNKSPLIKPLNLSLEEQKALITFLHTLTDNKLKDIPEYHIQ